MCVHVYVFMSGGRVGGGGGGGGGGGLYSKINLDTQVFSFKLLIICNVCGYGRTTERVTKALKL